MGMRGPAPGTRGKGNKNRAAAFANESIEMQFLSRRMLLAGQVATQVRTRIQFPIHASKTEVWLQVSDLAREIENIIQRVRKARAKTWFANADDELAGFDPETADEDVWETYRECGKEYEAEVERLLMLASRTLILEERIAALLNESGQISKSSTEIYNIRKIKRKKLSGESVKAYEEVPAADWSALAGELRLSNDRRLAQRRALRRKLKGRESALFWVDDEDDSNSAEDFNDTDNDVEAQGHKHND